MIYSWVTKDKKSLTEAKHKWEHDIKMYQEFLKSDTQTYEGRYGAQEYIDMAKNRLNDINQKLEKIQNKK